MSYTNGPWDAANGVDNENGVHSHIGIISDGWHIARVWGDGPNPDGDARLIAAAPDLLEACKVALYGGGTIAEATAKIRAAIAKAEGHHA